MITTFHYINGDEKDSGDYHIMGMRSKWLTLQEWGFELDIRKSLLIIITNTGIDCPGKL